MQSALSGLRYLKALGLTRNDPVAAAAYAGEQRAWHDRERVAAHLKASVAGVDQAALGSSAGSGDGVMVDFLTALRPLSAVLRLPLHRVPPLVPLLTATAGSTAHWTAEGLGRKLSVGTFTREPGLRLKKVQALSVATNELLRDPSVDAEQALLVELLAACAEALDRAFLDVANVGDDATPASVTSTATPIASSGSSLAQIDADLGDAVAALAAAGSKLTSAYWCMSSVLAAKMGLLRGTGGAPAYPGLGALGGVLAGLPVLTSAAATAAPASSSDDAEDIVLVDCSQITYSEGLPSLRTSTNALIEMSDAPTGDILTPATASAVPVSMFQAEATALLATMSANWKPRRSGMVQIIQGVVL